jgi:pyridoxine/pyridoxamine 5'-phosphate oxidase
MTWNKDNSNGFMIFDEEAEFWHKQARRFVDR